MPDDRNTPTTSPAVPDPFAVVALGASAGGLSAVREFFTGLGRGGAGAAYVLAMHREPNRESALIPLLEGMTPLAVREIEAGDPLRPGVVLVVPAGQIATLEGDRFVLVPRDPQPQHSIDLLFRSLADACGPRTVGIILSGDGSDGTEGMLAIQDHGGLTLAQAPEGLAHPGMPASAIRADAADHVFAASGMGPVLERWLTEFPLNGAGLTAPSEADEVALGRIVEALFQTTGADFSGYKRIPQERRVRRRQRLARCRSLSEYADRVQRNRGEAHRLRRDLLIRVTQFLRDPSAFGELVESALSSLIRKWEGPAPLRIWVPGCSTGEEAYTLAILALEVMREEGFTIPIQIFATDLDPESIRVARRGLYPSQIALQIPSAWLEHHFVREDDDGYRISKRVRECVVFSTHDLLRDPPFSRMDLVSCRNLLIYLNSMSQAWVIETFHYALNPRGILFLGTAESVPTDSPLFEPLGTRARLYRRTDHPTRPLARKVRTAEGGRGARGEARSGPLAGGGAGSPRLDVTAATLALARQFAPPAVLLDQQGEVLYFFEGSQAYFRPQAGPPGYHVLQLILEPLQAPLRCLLHQIRSRAAERRSDTEAPEPSVAEGVRSRPVPASGDPQTTAWITLVLQPVESPFGAMLLVFEPTRAPYETLEPPSPPPVFREAYGVSALQEELSRTQLSLNHAIQELERANAELRLSNEDLLSINEEVQSTNEELETSKEELESVNEELGLVNAELREKILELDRVNGDLQNLMASTQIATVFVDGLGQVLQYTPAATCIFRLIPSDRGRPLWDLSHGLALSDRELQDMIQRVQAEAKPGSPNSPAWQTEVTGAGNRVYMVQAYPYRATSGQVDGAVLNFIDLTEIRSLEAGIRRLATSIDLFPIPFIITDADWKIVSWNQGARVVFGYDHAEIVGEDYFRLVPDNVREEERTRLEGVRAAQPFSAARVQRQRKSGEIFPALNEVGWFTDGNQVFTTVADRDFTERARMEERSALLVRELDHRVKNTLALVQGLLEYSSLSAGDSMENFIQSFRSRLQALANSQRALASGVTPGASLRELLFRGIQGLGLGDRVRIDGPQVELRADLSFPVSMAIHELTTNAIRHGALSTADGDVQIEWQTDSEGTLTLTWAESGVPSLQAPDQTGFGTRLILEGLPYQTGGTASVQYTEKGIRWTITIPL
jgi:two-component system, chemotaxis family, CheB/CheR fusion protein